MTENAQIGNWVARPFSQRAKNLAPQRLQRLLNLGVNCDFSPTRHNQKELAQASNPGVLPFSVGHSRDEDHCFGGFGV